MQVFRNTPWVFMIKTMSHPKNLSTQLLPFYTCLSLSSSLTKYNSLFFINSFSNDSISNVKQFLVQYFDNCKNDGYMVIDDPLSDFYQALGVGCDGGDFIDVDGLLQLSPTTSGKFRLNN